MIGVILPVKTFPIATSVTNNINSHSAVHINSAGNTCSIIYPFSRVGNKYSQAKQAKQNRTTVLQ